MSEIVKRAAADAVPSSLARESADMPYRIFTDTSRVWLDDDDGGSLFAYVREGAAPAVTEIPHDFPISEVATWLMDQSSRDYRQHEVDALWTAGALLAALEGGLVAKAMTVAQAARVLLACNGADLDDWTDGAWPDDDVRDALKSLAALEGGEA